MKMARRMERETGKDGSRSVLDLLFIPIGALIEHVVTARWTAKCLIWYALTGMPRPRFEAGPDASSGPTRVSRLDSVLDRP